MLKNVYIWGAGKLGDLAYLYYKDTCNILGYIDNNCSKWGTTKNNIQIFQPDMLLNGNAAIIIAVMDSEGIEKQIKETYGLNDITIFGCYEKRMEEQKDTVLEKASIIIHFSGGLGNQMFQYALMRCYLEQGRQVYADIGEYDLPQGGIFELTDVFPNIHIQKCNTEQKYELLSGYLDNRIWKKYVIHNENLYKIDKSLLDIENGYIYGLHQNYYFPSLCRDRLLGDFRFDCHRDDKLLELCNDFRNNKGMISVHVRRGDYQSETYIHSLGNICKIDYYRRAIEYMQRNIQNCKFCFFSDDIEWVKKNIVIDDAIYIQKEMFSGYKNWFDLCLMSYCTHHIIANSTFSWWGAWLNENENKVVIAPEKWCETKDFEDICPENWIRL